MKLKRLTDDFQVEEQISLPHGTGPFAIYKLSKQSLGTLEAIAAIEHKWNLPRQRIAFAGLKDRHAATSQYITIQGGPQRGISQTNLQLDYIGQVERPIHASDIVANQFQIVVRDLDDAEAKTTAATLNEIKSDGLPNYFDDQRFGSVGESGALLAKPWCLGDYERAVWLALADSNVHDRPLDRDEKTILRQEWGNWQKCVEQMQPSLRRDVVMHLARQPADFKRAITVFPHPLRSLWLAAFQSHLWNQTLSRLIERAVGESERYLHAIGVSRAPFFSQLEEQQRSRLQQIALPLPSARLHLENGELRTLYDEVMAAEGMELRQVRVKYPRDTFFSKGERRAVFQPKDLSHSFLADDLYAGRQKLVLQFALPRGSYATILIKRLFGAAEGMEDGDEDGVE
ncbi:MAG TPA: tRNA pseudouridine(13) synthase TruD [Pirellulaceae bacterium]|jgi:tRNA pseudouridine13 synthase